MPTIAIIALTLLLCALPASSQTVPPPVGHGPILGLYTAADLAGGAEVDVHVDQFPAMLDLHVVLSYPGVDAIGAIEFAFDVSESFEAALGFVMVDPDDPLHDPWGPWQQVLIGYSTPRPVVDDHAWILRLHLLLNGPAGDGDIRLVPGIPSSLPGQMAFVGADAPEDILVMRPNSEGLSHDTPVFRVVSDVVASRSRTWPDLQVLFR
jgi:hypothetical protein